MDMTINQAQKTIADFLGYLYIPYTKVSETYKKPGWYAPTFPIEQYVGRSNKDLPFIFNYSSLVKVLQSLKVDNIHLCTFPNELAFMKFDEGIGATLFNSPFIPSNFLYKICIGLANVIKNENLEFHKERLELSRRTLEI